MAWQKTSATDQAKSRRDDAPQGVQNRVNDRRQRGLHLHDDVLCNQTKSLSGGALQVEVTFAQKSKVGGVSAYIICHLGALHAVATVSPHTGILRKWPARTSQLCLLSVNPWLTYGSWLPNHIYVQRHFAEPHPTSPSLRIPRYACQ